MSRNLNFSTLVPERDTFTDVDGKVYEFKAEVDFGAVHMARMGRLQDTLQAALKSLAANTQDESMATQFEQCADEIVALVLPTLPAERRTALSVGQKAALMNWWRENKGQTPNPKAPLPEPLPN